VQLRVDLYIKESDHAAWLPVTFRCQSVQRYAHPSHETTIRHKDSNLILTFIRIVSGYADMGKKRLTENK